MKRCFSLKRNKEFTRVYKGGKSVVSRTMVLIHRRTGTGLVKIGFSVSKKIGNSATRNKVKRRLRAAITPLIPSIKPGSSIVIIARGAILTEKFADVENSLVALLKKAALITGGRSL